MLGLEEYIYNTLSTDSTLKNTYNCSVFPGGVDVIQTYPCITMEVSHSQTRIVPVGARDVNITLTVWSSSSPEEAANIYERVWTLMNYVRANTPLSQKIYMSKEENLIDHFDHERNLWSKVSTYKFWAI